ncbi:uncharacterized protein LOC110376364 [Helicoverpa armigera]|uniref:uncharacterized protein LOC110376364 n=1 Tax=Helicoverpa armigera TaxID=29058 RepID=UPI0030833BA5
MLKIDNTAAKSNTAKCASAVKTALRKRGDQSLPSMSQSKNVGLLKRDKKYSPDIKTGINLKKAFNVERVGIKKSGSVKKTKPVKSSILSKLNLSQTDNELNRHRVKKTPKRSQGKLSNDKLNKEKPKQGKSNSESRTSLEIQNKGQRKCPGKLTDKTKNSPSHLRNLERRISTKIWQILSRDSFLLDYDKFNSQIQASDSETKRYIISVIKKCNNKEFKKCNIPMEPEPSIESISSSKDNRKKAMKRRVRRHLWQLAKTSIRHSAHWTQFLAENNIILDNINIDKIDLSLIDVDALGIENKLLKRTITWLLK